MTKLGTAFGGLLLIGALVAPVAFAHYDTGAHPLPYLTTGLDHWGLDDEGCLPAPQVNLPGPHVNPTLWIPPLGPEVGIPPGSENCGPGGVILDGTDRTGGASESVFAVNKDRPSGWYYGSTNVYAELRSQFTDPNTGINPSFLFAAWSGLYDAEVAGLGACPGGVHDPQDETTVDGGPGGLAPDGLFNDGGFGAVGHSTHYACPTYNTAGCDRYDQAWAEDMVSGEDIWIGAQCNWGVPVGGGVGIVPVLLQFVNDIINCPLGGFPQSCLNAIQYLDDCSGLLLIQPNTTNCGGPGATVVCGAGNVGDIDFGRGQGSDGPGTPATGPPWPDANDDAAWYPNAGTDSGGVNCDAFATAVCFPFTSVIATQGAAGIPIDIVQLSVATHGWCA